MIPFDLQQSIDILRRTPDVIRQLTQGMNAAWLTSNEGENTWSPTDVVGHLIQGEKEDWVMRTKMILATGTEVAFPPFDRFGFAKETEGKTFDELLDEFQRLREANLEELKAMDIGDEHLNKEGLHPEFGPVTLRQMLSTWTAHDLAHIGQIVRVMAKQYKPDIGPWLKYLRRLQD